MQNELTDLASTTNTALIGGALAILIAKDALSVTIKSLFGRFFRRAERIDTDWDLRHEKLITELVDKVTDLKHVFEGMRLGLEFMGERLDSNKSSIAVVGSRVDDVEKNHGCRISALEMGQVELRTRVEVLDRGGKE